MQINPWDGKNFGAESVRQQVETSLKRLKVIKNHYRQVIMILITIIIIIIINIILIVIIIITTIIFIIIFIITPAQWACNMSPLGRRRGSRPGRAESGGGRRPSAVWG